MTGQFKTPSDARMISSGNCLQHGPVIVRGHVKTSTMFEEKLDDLSLATYRRNAQRRAAHGGNSVNEGAPVEQQLHEVFVTSGCRQVQRKKPFRIRCVYLRAV
ncbi:unnamed protein product [Clonostachys solani]|uniref:Uncharacterized protein n=1 Tax=Clonostachys solani TaxID=160281 RepID=A0A9P0EGN9_9HYPO|nr:unnamed protein product [Clonostachys solani]